MVVHKSSYRALVDVVIISFFIVEVNKGNPQENAEEDDGVQCCMNTRGKKLLKINCINVFDSFTLKRSKSVGKNRVLLLLKLILKNSKLQHEQEMQAKIIVINNKEH